MTREEKAVIIEELSAKFANTNFFYITDAGGLSVAEVNSFRRLCFEKGVEYRVVKNTLIAKALEKLDTDYSSWNGSVLKGFSGIMFSTESSNLPAKLIKEFSPTTIVIDPISNLISVGSEHEVRSMLAALSNED